jgi:MIP family channel proteins
MPKNLNRLGAPCAFVLSIQATCEFVATMCFIFLSLTTVQAVLTDSKLGASGILAIATSFGLALMTCIAMVGNISGGHLNPAVTIALCFRGAISIQDALVYIIAQVCGATAGAGLADAVTPGPLLGVNAVSSSISPVIAFFAEALLTFVLVMTVFKTAVNSDMSSGFAPFYIGFSVFVIHLCGIPLTGTSVNPARTFGPAWVMGNFNNHWVFWAGPICGGLVAAILDLAFIKMYKRKD